VSAWLEAGLALCLFMLPPLLALVPRGAAPLVGVAGGCAAGFIALERMRRPAGSGIPVDLRVPAGILAVLLLWGGSSAFWSIDAGRSLLIGARLVGLFTAGLALAAAAGRVASPPRLALALLAGTALGVVLAAGDLVSAGGLTRHVSVRQFAGSRLDQIAAWLALLLMPTATLLLCRGQRLAALLATALIAAAVYLLDDTTAKIALTMGLPVAVLCYVRPVAVARSVAALSVIAILTMPLTLPRLGQSRSVFAAADSYKVSAGHRLLIWSFTGDRIAERPYLGWGLDAARAIPGGKDEIRPGQPWLPLHPHDAPLQVWLELGAPGAALYALFVGFLWLRLGEARWPPLYAAAAAGSLTVALVVALAGWGVWEEWWIATQCFALFATIVMARAATPPPRRG
jgi:O-antigen ligase